MFLIRYYFGEDGTDKNYNTSLGLFKQAAELGHVGALVFIGNENSEDFSDLRVGC